MNQFFTAGALAVITLVLWGIGKKPKTLLEKGIYGQFSINQTSLVQRIEPRLIDKGQADSPKSQFKPPVTTREKFKLRCRLKKLISSHPDERLIAVQIAGEWGDASVIPILKIGLRDMDSRVVINSAKAISQFRNQVIASKTKKTKSQPLNVSLMR